MLQQQSYLLEFEDVAVQQRYKARDNLDRRLDEVLVDQKYWSDEEREIFTARLIPLMMEDALETLASFHGGELLDRQEFEEALGWVLGMWDGVFSFKRACMVCQHDHQLWVEYVANTFAKEIVDLEAKLFGGFQLR